MTKSFRKNIKRSITGSMGRYIAILAIIALGVGFFAGLKSTRPSMILAARNYFEDKQMYDFRLLSTIGFDDEEIEKIGMLEEVADVEGAYSADFIAMQEDGNEVVLRAHSISTKMNLLDLKAGRLPQKPDECILDANVFGEDIIGQKIRMSDTNDTETKDKFTYKEYTVTGIANSPLYINMQRGTTSLASGSIHAFVFIPNGGFSIEYYTEAYATCETDMEAFTEEYDDYTDNLAKKAETSVTTIITDRFDEILHDANVELQDAEDELTKATEESDETLADAKLQLEDAKVELDDAKIKLEEAKDKLDDGAYQLDENYTSWEGALEKGKQSLTQAEKEYKDQIASAESQLEDAYQTLNSSQKEYEKNLKEFNKNKESYENGFKEYQAGYSDYEAQFAQAKAKLDETKAVLDDSKTKIDAGNQMLSSAKIELDKGFKQYESSKKQLEVEKKKGKEKIEEAKASLNEFEDGIKSYQDGIVEYENGLIEYNDGLKEYEDGSKERDEKLAEAREKIDDAKKELADLKEPTAYVFTRSMNNGYASFDSDSSIVDGVAKIFPVFFFLIAALVCSTTMTRMIDDDRTQIGTFRALGYSSKTILTKYLVYSGSAAIIGCFLGFYLGATLFPIAIWTAYGMLYQFTDIVPVYQNTLLLISLAVSLLCSVGTTFAACKNEMRNVPAELIRPKAPEIGKRILLERIPFLWKRLKFLYKVSLRNIFRFKKRMFMMILGISGCTALVLAGFGMGDSVSNIANFQYDDIMKYDIGITFSETITDEVITSIQNEYMDKIDQYAILNLSSADILYDGKNSSVYLVVTDDENITDIIDFHRNGESIPYPSDGEILITEKLAKITDKEVGDTIELKQGDGLITTLTVSGIVENYVNNYVYIGRETYEQNLRETYAPQTIYLRATDGVDVHELSASLQGLEDVSNIQVIKDLRDSVNDMMESLDYIILLVVSCAGALAFIVLFNLGNINISERIREIATIKVLGFHSRETGAYVFRENLILSIMSILTGLPLGILLHRFVLSQITVDMVTFKVIIKPISFLFTVIVVLGFTFITDLIMRKKMDRIDMAESLKSIE